MDVDELILRQVSAVECVDPRSTRKALNGEPVRGLAGIRARRAADAYRARLTETRPAA